MNKIYITAFIIALSLSSGIAFGNLDYHTSLSPVIDNNTIVTWNVIESPEVAFQWGWTGEGGWIMGNKTQIMFNITHVSTYVRGNLDIGNFSITANNTDIARELVLGVWGLTPFFSGLVVEVGEDKLNDLNETAYASAERVYGNYLNGTMTSIYEQVVIDSGTYNCISFDYVQDSSGYGEPQRTSLAYDTVTGVLVKANTSYSFGTPYILTLELASIIPPSDPMQNILMVYAGVGIAVLVIIVAIIVIKRK